MFIPHLSGRSGFTALVGAFANGGDVWQRLLVVLLHPPGAAGVYYARVATPPRHDDDPCLSGTPDGERDRRPSPCVADGRGRGDWELTLAFSVVPVIGVAYALALLCAARGTVG